MTMSEEIRISKIQQALVQRVSALEDKTESITNDLLKLIDAVEKANQSSINLNAKLRLSLEDVTKNFIGIVQSIQKRLPNKVNGESE